MKLPRLKDIATVKRQMVAFGGIHYGEGASAGELEESQGLSSARFPALSQRAARTSVGCYQTPTGLFARGALCVVDGTDFLYDGQVVGQVTVGEKKFAAINTKVVIFPDKAVYDTATGEFGALEAYYPVHPGTLTLTGRTLTVPARCYYDREDETEGKMAVLPGTAIKVYTGTALNAGNGSLTLQGEASKTASALLEGDIIEYGCAAGQYRVVRTAVTAQGLCVISYAEHTVTRHDYPSFDAFFSVGDAVELTGCTEPLLDNNRTAIVRGVEERTLTFYEGAFVAGAEPGGVMLARKVPDMEVVCECDNRIWGAAENVIYASALGDPRNFHIFDGLSTDSYAVAVGSEGGFTGCVAFSTGVLFWKEHCLHKVLGTEPGNFQLYTYQVPGVQAGSEKSMAIANEVLYYKGKGGVYRFTGGVPSLISACFGARRFGRAAAGTDGDRYYISMQEEETLTWGLYAFDTRRGIWLREDGTHAAEFTALGEEMYFLDSDSGRVYQVGQGAVEEDIEWSATLAPFAEESQGRRGYSKLWLRLELAAGAWVRVEVACDGGPWRQVYLTSEVKRGAIHVPIRPNRCDKFRVRLSGRGECLIKSLAREFHMGSEV